MAHSVDYRESALRQLRKMNRSMARRIVDYLDDVPKLPDPRLRGIGLTGDRAGLWRYRVGDDRVLCELRDTELVILALEIGHRSHIYSR